jgi:OOP family OmpA-OmpF porin
MKAWYLALPIAVALSIPASAQDAETDDARTAELQCQLAGICGELAQSEAEREKQEIDNVDTRAMLTIGQVMAARKGARQPGPAAKAATPSRAEVPARAEAVRTAKRNLPAASARRPLAPTAKRIAPGGSAADVPASLTGRAPLFVTFGLNSAKLTRESASEVASFAKALKNIAASGIDKRYRIEGHTDSSGDPATNRRLSEERAAAVRAALLEAGIDGSRIEIAGFGSDQPIEGFRASDPVNRRVEAVEIK